MNKEDIQKSAAILNDILDSGICERMTHCTSILLGTENGLNTHNQTHRIRKTNELYIQKYGGLVECVDTKRVPLTGVTPGRNYMDRQDAPGALHTTAPVAKKNIEEAVIKYDLKPEALDKIRTYIRNGAR